MSVPLSKLADNLCIIVKVAKEKSKKTKQNKKIVKTNTWIN